MTDSNRKNTTDFSVPNAFLPVLAHALAISRNTQMMSGAPAAEKMAEALRIEVEARIPDAIRIFDDAHWCEAATATQSECVHVGIHPRGWRNGGMTYAVIAVTDSGRFFTSNKTFAEQEASRLASEIAALLEEASSAMPALLRHSEEEAEECYRDLLRDPDISRNELVRRTQHSVPGGLNALVHFFPRKTPPDVKSGGCLRIHAGKHI